MERVNTSSVPGDDDAVLAQIRAEQRRKEKGAVLEILQQIKVSVA